MTRIERRFVACSIKHLVECNRNELSVAPLGDDAKEVHSRVFAKQISTELFPHQSDHAMHSVDYGVQTLRSWCLTCVEYATKESRIRIKTVAYSYCVRLARTMCCPGRHINHNRALNVAFSLLLLASAVLISTSVVRSIIVSRSFTYCHAGIPDERSRCCSCCRRASRQRDAHH